MKGPRSAVWEPQADRNRRAPLRRAQWSSYFLRFFGAPQPGDSVPGSFVPVSPESSAEVLHRAYCGCEEEKRDLGTRYLVRRCLSQMLLHGYQPKRKSDVFDQLVKAAAAPRPGDVHADEFRAGMDVQQSSDSLVRWGQREFGLPGSTGPRTLAQALEALRRAAPDDRTLSLPTEILHDAGTTSVTKRVFLRQKLSNVNRLVNPINWVELGEFFVVTKRETDGNRAPTNSAESWYGVLTEEFIVSWNRLTTHRFDQKLKIDYTVLPNLARTDYSLMYERDDQIEVNEGYFEVWADESLPPGWIAGTMRKTVRFKSSFLNFLAPATLAMFLDSQTGGFGAFVDKEESGTGRSTSRGSP